MMTQKKRGRPLSEQAQENLLAAQNLATRPSRLSQNKVPQQTDMISLLASMDQAEKEILKKFRYSQTTSKSHAYAMASLGDETLDDLEEKILERDKKKRNEVASNRDKGTKAVQEIASTRADEICRINRILLERLKPYGLLSLSDVASKIIQDWYDIPLGSKLPGEPTSLRRRGVDGPPPTARTIRNYIRQASPLAHQRVGKTSMRKK
jgi:hypothetical protein